MHKINVLVYAGAGASVNSTKRAVWSLRRLLSPNHAVLTVTSEQILNEPWTATCALLVMPGGADTNYCRVLNGRGNQIIKDYVLQGGNYLGFCAGGYYGSARCEFEVGRKEMEVVGDRELAFFPGICRGLAFPGFRYGSEAGAKACSLIVNRDALRGDSLQDFHCYYNGGGVFVDVESRSFDNVEILASYADELAVDAGEGKAAAICCKLGSGAAILIGPHPEFAAEYLHRHEASNPNYSNLVDDLARDDQARIAFLRACLSKLHLRVAEQTAQTIELSPLQLSSSHPEEISQIWSRLQESGHVTTTNGQTILNGGENNFITTIPDSRSTSRASSFDSGTLSLTFHQRTLPDEEITLKLVLHKTTLPDFKTTPSFNHSAFFTYLSHYQTPHRGLNGDYGATLLYGAVVSSTNTLLERNPNLLSHLPIGTTAVATTQLAGRGRGSNVWVNPPGSLLFSTVLKHSLSLSDTAPVVFVQYLAAMAVVAGVKAYEADGRYGELEVRLKWPNDIYARDGMAGVGKEGEDGEFVKVGGVLVNSSYSGAEYTLVVGVGLNVNNAAPTTGLSVLARKLGLPDFELEKLLASILVQFEVLYARFCVTGFDMWFEKTYYRDWLHTGQIVTLETEGDARARIKGITTDWGLLLAEEVDAYDRATGRTFALQSDSNSFNFFKGLLKRKL